MAELNDSLLQFDSGILDVNENLSNSENTLLSYSENSNVSLSPQRDNINLKDEIINTSFTVSSNNSSNKPDNFTGFVSNAVENLTQNSNAFDNNIKSESNNFSQDMKLLDFNCADLNFPDGFNGMKSDFSSEENCADAKDEEFHDAVQFFKDPSSLTFLENAGSASVPSEPLITRSSLYVNFDPLHAKYYSQSTKADELGGIEHESQPKVPSTTDDSQIPVQNHEFKIPDVPDKQGRNVDSKVLREKAMSELLPESEVPKISPENSVPEIQAKNAVPEIQAKNAVPEIQAKNAVPEMQAENLVPNELAESEISQVLAEETPKVSPENVVPEVQAENSLPQVQAENILPCIQAENRVAELHENKVPHVPTENVVPLIQAANIVSEIFTENILPELQAENIVSDITAENIVPEIIAENIVPDITAENVVPELQAENILSELTAKNTLREITAEKTLPEITPRSTVPEITPRNTVPEITPRNTVPEITAKTSMLEITAENTVPGITTENIVPEITTENIVPEITAKTSMLEITAENTGPGITTENIVPEITTENIVPEITTENIVPETTTENIVPETTTENIVPKTTTKNTLPEITAENTLPEISAENTVPEITIENIVPEKTTKNTLPEISAKNSVPKILAHNVVPEILSESKQPEVPAVCEIECEIFNKHMTVASPSPRISFGNLLSFDSPLVDRNTDVQIKQDDEPSKLYTEEELQQALKIKELSIQETFLKRQHDLELERTQKQTEMDAKFKEQSLICSALQTISKELYEIILARSNEESTLQGKLDEAEKEISKLKEDLKTSVEDLQSTESTFADFHKRYEHCKSMLKDYTQNEANLKLQMEDLRVQINEKDEMYKVLQSRTQEMLDKANIEVSNAKRAGDAQIAVLKAQLKKAELKISSLESDVKHVKVENEKLSSICDDLMAKVSEG